MEGVPKLKPENLIYIGPSQTEDAEVKYLLGRGDIEVITSDKLSEGLGPVYEAIDKLQRRVPLWLEVDEDASEEVLPKLNFQIQKQGKPNCLAEKSV